MPANIVTTKIQKGLLSFRTYLKEQTVNAIINCLKQVKEDIETELHQYIFLATLL